MLPSRFVSPRFRPLRVRLGRWVPWALVALLAVVPAAPGQEEEQDGGRYDYRGENGESDSVDALFPQNPERVRQLKAIERAVDDADWDRAADALLFIVGEAEGELVRLTDGSAAMVVDEAARMLDRFPAAERRNLSRRLGGAARAALDAALEGGNAGAIQAVAVRFPGTDAARDARIRLALLHLDRGEPGLAARAFATLLEDPDAASELLANARRKAAVVAAFARGGQPDRAKELWDGFEPAERAALGLSADDGAAGELPASLTSPAESGSGAPEPVLSGDPLLVPRWSVPIVADPGEREDFREAVDRLQRAGAGLLPVWEPLTVSTAKGDLVLTRTTEDVLAADAVSGEILWRSRPSGLAVEGRTQRQYGRFQGGMPNPAEQNDTIASVYREAAFGLLTSDGVRVFLLEADTDSGSPAGSTRFNGQPNAGGGRSVRLVAYRLDTGRLDWEVGGTLRDEPFDLPLAGWRPLAAPTVDGGDLFLVAERVAADGLRRIALFCLDPTTGRDRWSRTVAFSEASVDSDPTRAEWGAWCTVANGVVVVPTTVGWVAGVDRLTRDVLWVERVSEPEADDTRRFRGFIGGNMSANATLPETLEKYWRPGPPRALGNRVIVAPPGEDKLYGLDLLTGKRLWRPRPRRSNWKAVAALLPAPIFAGNEETGRPAADDGAYVIVGPTSLAAIALHDGLTRVWTYTVPDDLGQPSGMPLVAGDRLFVPLSTGALVTLDAATGERTDVSWRTDAGGPAHGLGALGVSGGRLVSVGPGGLVGFEDRAGLTAELAAAANAAGPPDPLLALREAELLRTAGRTGAALAKLDSVADGSGASAAAPAGLSAADAERYRALLRATLRDAILGEPDGDVPPPDRQDALLDRLETQADTPARRIAVARLRAERLRVRGELAGAVDALQGLIGDRLDAADPLSNPLVPAAEGDAPPPPAPEADAPEPDAEVRLSRAVSRELRSIWNAGAADRATEAAEAGRAAVDALAVQLLDRDGSPEGKLAPSSAAAELLPFHPAIAEALVSWSEDALAAPGAAAPRAAAEAELTLIRIADSRDDAVGVRAEAALKSLEESGGESAGVSRESVVVAEAVAGDAAVRPRVALPTPAAVRPFFRSHVLVSSTDGARLDLLDVSEPDGPSPVVARFPLLGQANSETVQRYLQQMRGRNGGFTFTISRTTGRPAMEAAGGVLFAVTRGAVAAVHPQTATTLWSRAIEGAEPASPGNLGMGVPSRTDVGPKPMQRVSRLARNTSRRPRGGVVAANAEVVVLLNDRTLTVLDARTGEVVWVRRRLESQSAAALATSTAVLLTASTAGTGPGLALAARDGAPLETEERALNVVARALAIAGGGIVHVVEGPTGGYFFTSWDPGNDREMWIRRVDGDAQLIVLADSGPPLAVIVSPDGPDDDTEDEGLLVDLRTGASTVLGGVNVGGANLSAVADEERVILIAGPTRGGASNRKYSIQRLPTTTVGGTIDVFARSGGRLWRTDASGTELLHEGADRSAFLTLLTADPDAARGELSSVELVALDKRTGRELLRTVIPILTELQQGAVSPAGDALHLWNNNNPAEEYWLLRAVPKQGGGGQNGVGENGSDTGGIPSAATPTRSSTRPVDAASATAARLRRSVPPEQLEREQQFAELRDRLRAELRLQAVERQEQLRRGRPQP